MVMGEGTKSSEFPRPGGKDLLPSPRTWEARIQPSRPKGQSRLIGLGGKRIFSRFLERKRGRFYGERGLKEIFLKFGTSLTGREDTTYRGGGGLNCTGG